MTRYFNMMKPVKKMNYYLVDDSREFIEAMKLFIEVELKATVCGIAYDGADALQDEALYEADIVLMDINMKQLDGITTTKQLTERNHQLRIVAVTNSRHLANKQNLIANGFMGCVCKNKAFKEIPLAIENITMGKFYFPKGIPTKQ
jgi:DNA-binding NarL/FixJ family response regulator